MIQSRLRRIRSISVAALVVILTMLTFGASGVGAQQDGFSVTVYKAMCYWEDYSHEARLDFAAGTAPGAHDCLNGWQALTVTAQISLDGALPDYEDDNSAVWYNMPAGSYTIGVQANGADNSLTIEISDADVIAWASFYYTARVEGPPVIENSTTVRVYKATCDWTGSTPGAVLDYDAGTTETARDCVESWNGSGVNLSLAGNAPDTEDAYVAIWHNVPNGTNTIIVSGTVPAMDSLTFEVNGEDEIVYWATYYNSVRGEDPVGGAAGNADSGSVGGVVGNAGSGLVGSASVISLPNTGSGTSSSADVIPFGLLAMTLIVAAGAFLARQRRTLIR